MSLIKLFSLFILLLVTAACNNSAGDKFGALDGKVDDGSSDEFDTVSITSWTPETTPDSPLVMTNNSSAVFGVLVPGNVGTMSYDFINYEVENYDVIDSEPEYLFNDVSTAFKNITGTSFSAGKHVLKIAATNGKTTADKTFYIRKNYSPGIFQSSIPYTNTINCAEEAIEFTAAVSDMDNNDPKTITWELNTEDVITEGPDATPFVTISEPVPNFLYKFTYEPDCSKAGTHVLKVKASDGYDTTEATWNFTVNDPPPEPNVVDIISWIPTQSPEVVMTGTASTTFGVTVADGSGAITYTWVLDNDEDSAVTGSTSFYSLNGADLSIGIHFLEVTATNGSTSDKKTFKIRKNTPPNILNDFIPALTGNTLQCSDNLSMVIQANVTDANNDNVTVKWYLDESLVTGGTAFVSTAITGSATDVEQTTLTYNPDCSKVGFHSFKLVLNDGYENYTQTWTVNVTNPPAPPGDVMITNVLPQDSVVVVTGTSTTTFAVSIQDGAGAVKYKFFIDGNPNPVADSSNAFLIRSGSTFTPGDHNIRVVAYSTIDPTNNDEHTFFVRRNKAPTIGQTPASDYYSPSDEEVSAGADPAPSCGSTITFDAYIDDDDDESADIQTSWQFDNATVTTNSPNIDINPIFGLSERLTYTTSCNNTGPHQVTVRTNDGHETTEKSWLINVVNPAKESLGSTTPSGSTVVVLSTDPSKTFTASAATGIAPFTFTWTKGGLVVKTETGNSSSYEVTRGELIDGNQTIKVALSDSSSTNNPALPAERSWTVYKNKKPSIAGFYKVVDEDNTIEQLSNNPIAINTNTEIQLIGDIDDTADETALQVTISRGTSSCPTSGTCGLTLNSVPTSDGIFNASFISGTTYLGDNTFTLSVRDQHGETDSESFNISSNFFSKKCNELTAKQICTLSGMPGLGEDLDLTIPANTVRPKIHPFLITTHDVQLPNKNFVFTDETLDVVWYWNRNSTDISLGPLTIKKNSVQAIFGNPNYGSSSPAAKMGNISVTDLRNFHLSNPYGVAVSSTGSGSSMVTDIYVAEYTNTYTIGNFWSGRVFRLRFDNSNTNTVSVLRSRVKQSATSGCNPYGLALNSSSSPTRLYVSCYDQQQIRHINLSLSSAFTLDNTDATATNIVSTPGTVADGLTPGTASTRYPTAMFFDENNQLLYFTERANPYSLRVYNPGATKNLGVSGPEATGGWIKTISGGVLGNTPGPYNTATYGNSISITPYWSSGTPKTLKGIFYSDYTYHRIAFINLSGSTLTLGNQSVLDTNVQPIFGIPGITGSTNNNSLSGGGKKSTLNTPYGLVIDNDVLFVADGSNNKIRSLVLNDPDGNGLVSTSLGLLPKSGFNESATLQSEQVIYNRPRSLKYDRTNNRLLIVDSPLIQPRIRALNLNTGIVDTVIGGLNASLLNNQATPLQTSMRDPRDIEIHEQSSDEFLVYTDNQNHIKALNMYGEILSILGSDIDPGKTGLIAGTNANGSWSPINDGDLAINVSLRDPYGIGSDPITGSLYHTDFTEHCIKKVDQSGLITQFIGSCGTGGNIPGAFSSARLTSPGDIAMDTLHEGNFYFLDNINVAASKLKYANIGLIRNIFGSQVAANFVIDIPLTISPNFASAVAVTDDKICIASGSFTTLNNEQTLLTALNYANQSVICYTKSGSECLFIGKKYNPLYSDASFFRGRMPKYDQQEGIGAGGLEANNDTKNIPVTLSGPQGLAFDDEGNLYISEFYGNTIRKVKAWTCN